MISVNSKDPVSTKGAVQQLEAGRVKTDLIAPDTLSTSRTDNDWLLTDMATTNDAPESRSQFELICDNVQLDVAGHHSLLGDLGRILQNVFGLAAAVTDHQASIENKVSR